MIIENKILKQKLKEKSNLDGEIISKNIIHHLVREQILRSENSELRLLLSTNDYLIKKKQQKNKNNKEKSSVKFLKELEKENSELKSKLRILNKIGVTEKIETKCLINNDIEKAKIGLKKLTKKNNYWKKKFFELKNMVVNDIKNVKEELDFLKKNMKAKVKEFYKICTDLFSQIILELNKDQNLTQFEIDKLKNSNDEKSRKMSQLRNKLRNLKKAVHLNEINYSLPV